VLLNNKLLTVDLPQIVADHFSINVNTLILPLVIVPVFINTQSVNPEKCTLILFESASNEFFTLAIK